ncbi:Cell surface glycoprotein CD200 receptor 1 [Merluccius polli]|uniref:Cell surface glycoprotein CD200 receptor 1 n=1 Tax=Merluccius polli TaxID=89951 RepID=A0AA47NLF7_MERPO|nr:Cell surface glycoprotein CD200 receptor 1 [Merluccius polli]
MFYSCLGARNQTGIQGTDVNLTCTNKTWSEIFFVIWNITLHHRECTISLKDDGQSRNTCGGNWALLNTSSGEPYLLIPNISPHDEGLYECQVAYKEGTHSVNISLILLVSPRVSAWLKWQGSKRVAVCVAEKGKPAASVHWRISGNLTTPQTKLQELPGGFYTVRSVLELPEDTAEENVTCVVNHPSWEEEHTIRAVHLRCECIDLLY